MKICSAEAAVAAFRQAFAVELADTPARIREALHLRHQVYCMERGFEPKTAQQIESDEFDDSARHIVVRDRRNRDVVGTVRLVLPAGRDVNFPMQRVCGHVLARALPMRKVAEISRFSISKERRDWNAVGASLLRIGLSQGVVRVSRDLGLSYWYAIMERSLLRLLRSSAIHFNPIGPCVEYHGIRQPTYANIDELLARTEAEQPAIWDLLTDNGRYWSSAPAEDAMAEAA